MSCPVAVALAEPVSCAVAVALAEPVVELELEAEPDAVAGLTCHTRPWFLEPV